MYTWLYPWEYKCKYLRQACTQSVSRRQGLTSVHAPSGLLPVSRCRHDYRMHMSFQRASVHKQVCLHVYHTHRVVDKYYITYTNVYTPPPHEAYMFKYRKLLYIIISFLSLPFHFSLFFLLPILALTSGFPARVS